MITINLKIVVHLKIKRKIKRPSLAGEAQKKRRGQERERNAKEKKRKNNK